MDLQALVESGVLSFTALTAVINELPATPAAITKLGLFQEEGVDSTIILIAKQGSKLTLVPNVPRGAPAQPKSLTPRNARPFMTGHLPQRSTVMADSLQNVKVLGNDDPNAGVSQKVSALQATHRRDNDLTLEYQRLGAIKGQILDADGSVIYDLFEEFGVSQVVVSLVLGTATTKVRNKVVAIKRAIEAELGGLSYTQIIVFCGSDFFDTLVSHPDVEKAYERYQEGTTLRDDLRKGFTFGGVTFVEYSLNIGAGPAIEAGVGYAVPLGVPDLFITRFAPADYIETVNTIGLPYYSKAQVMDFNKGIELESQCNPLNLCTRPRAIVKVTK
jgi:copper chaperone CopZ